MISHLQNHANGTTLDVPSPSASLVSIGSRRVGPGEPILIIAEAGVNHNGDFALATQLVDAALNAGADAVKFQTFRAAQVASAAAQKAGYQMETTGGGESQLAMLSRLELPDEAYRELEKYCRRRGILFLSTPFDEPSVDLLDNLNVPAFKVGSGELTNLRFLRYIANRRKPVILSTGMATLNEVSLAVNVLCQAGCTGIIVLHCVSAYPAQPADANLRAIATMAADLQLPVGFSDHTLSFEVPIAAAALGASVIEKHITLDPSLPGPDHRSSFDPSDFQKLCQAIRNVEKALGDGVKRPSPNELDVARVARRSLHLSRDLDRGHALRAEDLIACRPGTGISAARWDSVVGRRLAHALAGGVMLTEADLE
ncbi:MAG: N-acetylneuraminate synthase [Acidobacteriaceae bacterium]|nr:N-acetylneuraminate synthase [Acidobacteriaceae bacterium]MBV9781854.1 N-acetylneuraminate synthase [Acidobacteriaceae bacterium]